jgi:ribosome biogenesis GTPase
MGWNEQWEQAFAPHAAQGLVPGRVVVEHRTNYRVVTQTAELTAEVGGKLRREATGRKDFPAVGDFVALSIAEGNGPVKIQSLLPRRTAFIRQAVGERTQEQVVGANLDTVFIISALDSDFNVRRLERYLTLAWESGAQPVILLNKADLCDAVASRLMDVEQISMGVPTHVLTARTADGLDALTPYLYSGQTVCVLGSSGVGKSTLINQILGQPVQVTQEVRAGDDRGRHTTTHRELFVLPSGAMIIDTPGMRELRLWGSAEGLESAFGDIELLASACHFPQCRHDGEPSCAVQAAIARGELLPERYTSYVKLARELRFLESRQDERASLERKRAEKLANKSMKHYKKRG